MHNWRKKRINFSLKDTCWWLCYLIPSTWFLSMWSTHKCHQTRGLCCSMLWI